MERARDRGREDVGPVVGHDVGQSRRGERTCSEAGRRAKAVGRPASAPAKVADAPEEKFDDRIDVILDIDLPLVVRFGRTELPLKTLARMGPGSLIDLGRSADDPVEVLVSNRVVARGEVVIVGGNYGVRILDVVSPKE